MISKTLIIYEYQILYKILSEIKEYLNLHIQDMLMEKKVINKIKTKKYKKYKKKNITYKKKNKKKKKRKYIKKSKKL